MSAPIKNHKSKNPEAFFMAVKHPTLNKQKGSEKLTLFRNDLLQTVFQGLFTLGMLFFASCNSMSECTMMSLTSVWLLNKFDWSKCSDSLIDLQLDLKKEP